MTLLYADALAALGRGDLGAARRLAADGLAEYGSPMSGRYVWPLLWLAARTEADEATLARDRREEVPDGAAARCRELASLAAGLAAPTAPSRGYQALVAAELARAAGQADLTAWSAAAGRGRRRPSPIRWPTPCCGWPRPPPRRATARPPAQRPRAYALASGVGAMPIAQEARRWPGAPG